jgi:hypothetical protein
MFQLMVESVDMYGTKHTLKNQKGEKIQKSRLGGVISIFTYVLLAIALYFKVDMIMKQGVTDTIEHSNNKRGLQDLIQDPVIDGGIDSGGNIPIDQQDNTIPIVTPDPVPKPVVVTDGNAGNVVSKKKNFRWTETINIPYE